MKRVMALTFVLLLASVSLVHAQREVWTAQNSGTPAGLASVFFVDAQTGWAVSSDGPILAKDI